MDDMLVADIRERISEQRARTGPPEGFPTLPDLPMARYTDQDYYRDEIEHVLKKRWLFACNESELAEPGQYKLIDIPFAPVVIARGKDGALRAFLNACRHRGAAVVTQECGTARYLTCPYHAWSYDLTGKLVATTDKGYFADLDRENRSLIPVRCEQWGTFIFVNLDQDAIPLAEDFAPLISRFSDFMNADMRLVAKRTYDVKANWKIPVDGFLESYHVATVHVRSGGNIFDAGGGAYALFPNGHSAMYTPYYPEIDIETFFPRNAPEIADARIFEDLNPNMFCFPNMVSVMNASNAPMIQIWPTGVDTFRMDVSWYAVAWGDAPSPPGWEMKLEGFDAVFAEDVELYEPMQRGLAAAAGTGAPLQFKEMRVYQFHVELDREMGPERVAPSLVTPNVLDGLIEK